MMAQFFYSQGGQQYGPVSSDQLKGLARTGQLEPNATVVREGMSRQKLAKDIPGLFPISNQDFVVRQAPSPPSASPSIPPPPPLPEQCHVRTADGQQFGPITKAQLDLWVAEQRIDASCQIWQTGWLQWKAAGGVYPTLAVSSGAPAAPQQSKQTTISQLVHAGIREMTDPERVKAWTEAHGRYQEKAKKAQAEIGEHLNKLARNPVVWVAAGGFFLLFFVLLPLVAILNFDSNLDSASRANTKTTTKTAAERVHPWHEHDYFDSFSTIPPPVEDAIKQGKEVWKLTAYQRDGHKVVRPKESYADVDLFVIMDGDIVESVAAATHTPQMGDSPEFCYWWLVYIGKPATFDYALGRDHNTTSGTITWTGERNGSKLQLHRREQSTMNIAGMKFANSDKRDISATIADGWSEHRDHVQISTGTIDPAGGLADLTVAQIQNDPNATISDDGRTWTERKTESTRYAGTTVKFNSGKARSARTLTEKHPESTAKSSKAETAKQHLLDTAARMEGSFAAVIRDVIISVEQGVPWSVADGRMRNPGNFRFSSETMKAYQEWRESVLENKP